MTIIKNEKIRLYIVLNSIFIFFTIITAYFLELTILSFATIYMFFPLLATIIIIRKYSIDLEELGLRIGNVKWIAIAWLLPLVLVMATMILNVYLPGVSFSITFENLSSYGVHESVREGAYASYTYWDLILTMLKALGIGFVFNSLFAFGEEIGWRGLLYRELRGKGFWTSSFIIGLLWGIWHMPMILNGYNYPNHPVIGSFQWIFITILMSPVYTLIKDKTQSLLVVSIFHGTLNALVGLTIGPYKGGTDLVIGIPGVSGIVILLLVNLVIFFYIRKE